MLGSAALAAIILLSGQGAVYGSVWSYSIVDSDAGSPSIALYSQGLPHIAYTYDGGSSPSLRYASYSGTQWTVQTVKTSTGLSTYQNSLALDSNGNPWIVYETGYTNAYSLYASSNTTGSWNSTMITQSPGKLIQDAALVADSSNNPRVCYTNSSAVFVTYAAYSAGTWNSSTINFQSLYPPDDGVQISAVAMALDSNGNPWIAANNYAQVSLMYAHFDGTNWTKATSGGTCYSQWSMQIVLGPNGYPQMLWGDSEVDLYGLTSSGAVFTTIDTSTKCNVALALDSSGYAHVLYEDATTQALKYAVYNGSSWNIEKLASPGNASNLSMVLDDEGLAHIAYYDSLNHNLMYVEEEVPEPTTLSLIVLGCAAIFRQRLAESNADGTVAG